MARNRNLDYESTESDRLLPKADCVPRDRLRLVYVIFYLLGIGTLLPWNFFSNAQAYFMYKLRNITLYPNESSYEFNTSTATDVQVLFESYLSVAAMLPSVIFMFINTAATKLIRLKVRMVGAALVMIVLFAATIILTQVNNTDLWQTDFFVITLVTVVVMNAGSAVLQGGIFGLASTFPPQYIQAVMGGMGMGGSLAALANIGATAALSHEPLNMGFGYFLTAEVIIALALTGYLILPLMRFARFHEEKHRRASQAAYDSQVNSSQSDGTVSAESSQEVSFSKSSTSIPVKMVFKNTALYGLSVCLIFATTLSVFPATAANIRSMHTGTTWADTYFTPVTCFLIFNVTDLIGRTVAGMFQFPKEGSPVMAVIAVCRVLFVPAFWLCNVQPRHSFIPVLFHHDAAPITLMTMLGLSNGYFGTLCMMYGPRRVPPEEVEVAGSLMSFFLSLGLGFGSLLSFIFMNFLFNQ